MKIGRLALRTVVGGLFVGHGTQKLFGWFDGQGLDATAQGFDAMGLRPGRTNAIVAGASEAVGGAAFAAGFETPFAAAPLIGSMLMAIKHVHAKNGPWSHKGGYEYNLVLIAAALAVVEAGPGSLSIDGRRGKEKTGLGWTLLSLGLAAGGVAAVERIGEMQSRETQAAQAPAAYQPAPVDAAERPAATPAAPATPAVTKAPPASTPAAADKPAATAAAAADKPAVAPAAADKPAAKAPAAAEKPAATSSAATEKPAAKTPAAAEKPTSTASTEADKPGAAKAPAAAEKPAAKDAKSGSGADAKADADGDSKSGGDSDSKSGAGGDKA